MQQGETIAEPMILNSQERCPKEPITIRLNATYRSLPWFGKVRQPSKPSPNGRVEQAMPKLDGYLRIKEAAKHLGVSPNTLRNWGRSGKLAERRHPMNGYRLYSEKELDALLKKADCTANIRIKPRKPK